jgi:D-3-phosphoglycerate dehydrogenase
MRIAYERWTDSAVVHELTAHGIELCRLDLDAPASRNWSMLETVHGYAVPSRVDCVAVDDGEQWLVDARFLARCPQLLVVCTPGAGYESVDVEACTRAGVLACNNSGPGAGAVAEHALGLMLAVTKRIVESDRLLRSEGSRLDRLGLVGRELCGRTLGIVGLGAIGCRTASLARAFGMTVIASDPDPPIPQPAEVVLVAFEHLLEAADIVHVSCPLSADTRGLFDTSAFAAMRQGAIFISTARGEVHDEDALFSALARGHLAGAGLDVFHQEPPPVDHPLLTLPNVVATPHVGGYTVEARQALAQSALAQWLRVAAGETPHGVLNPQVSELFQRRWRLLNESGSPISAVGRE